LLTSANAALAFKLQAFVGQVLGLGRHFALLSMLDGDVEIQELSADELLNASAKTNANDHVATDIEMANFAPQSLSASVPSRVEGHLPKSARSASQAVCMAKKLERNNNLKKLLAPGASRDDHEGWFDPKAKQPKKTSHSNIEWDVFLSYRVAADKNLVGELYWQLHSLTVMDCGKERKLRVFWDVECLKSGEKWEQGFSKAICSTSLVVIVMSRNAYKMEGETHNVEGLTEESNCDNVILEYVWAGARSQQHQWHRHLAPLCRRQDRGNI